MGRWGTKSESRGPGESEGGARAKGGTAPGGSRRHPSKGETRKLAERRRKPTAGAGQAPIKGPAPLVPAPGHLLGVRVQPVPPAHFPASATRAAAAPGLRTDQRGLSPASCPAPGWGHGCPALRGPEGGTARPSGDGAAGAECPLAVEERRGAGWSLGTHRAAVSPRDPPQPASRNPRSCHLRAQGRWPPPPPQPRPHRPDGPGPRCGTDTPSPKPAFLRTTLRKTEASSLPTDRPLC